jgi:hypothetical protein
VWIKGRSTHATGEEVRMLTEGTGALSVPPKAQPADNQLCPAGRCDPNHHALDLFENTNQERSVLSPDLEASTHTRRLSTRLMKQGRQTRGAIHRKVELSECLVELMDLRQVGYASLEDVAEVRRPLSRFHQHLIVLERSLSAPTWASANQGPRSGMHGTHSLASPSLLVH